MSLNASLTSYISKEANSLLAPYNSQLKSVGAPSVGLPSYSASASSSASSGPSSSGDISGGTAFNVGGINLGTQYPTAATAGGGSPSNPLSSASIGGFSLETIAIVGVMLLGAILIYRKL